MYGQATGDLANPIDIGRCPCRGTQLDALGPPALPGDRGWTRAAVTGAIPRTARSVDLFITVVGKTASATVYVDEVQAYPDIPGGGP